MLVGRRLVRQQRTLYSFAWTRLMEGENFPDHFFYKKAPGLPPPGLTPQQVVNDWISGPFVPLKNPKPSTLDDLYEAGYRRVSDILPHMPQIQCIKRTFQPSLIRRKRKWGFLVRMRHRHGRAIVNRRRHKQRWRLAL
ncbi:hypothetical protein CTAYLR_000619 [Chrysophaeum taylorii]|uniref:Ribosomal protein L34 n=1 Tax=Chrysophaeum taylorii TaxID=2483200 RepID=A0AAD7U9E0_9STRA|nr:hypothetical protein CTAYLR_000619 [Chrysophaeum taylorii]